jgi:hypothetical protein
MAKDAEKQAAQSPEEARKISLSAVQEAFKHKDYAKKYRSLHHYCEVNKINHSEARRVFLNPPTRQNKRLELRKKIIFASRVKDYLQQVEKNGLSKN